MTTFTNDDNGQKYELDEGAEAISKHGTSSLVIRPIPEKPKWNISWLSDDGLTNNGVAVEFDCSDKDQAQLIKEAVNQTMVKIFERPGDPSHEVNEYTELDEAIDRARQSMRENN